MNANFSVHLSKREMEVMDLLAKGLANKEIAERLGLSVETVRDYLKHIYAKFAVGSRTEAALKYLSANGRLAE
jgi:DNA-binding NarL/FixJ family response regulator